MSTETGYVSRFTRERVKEMLRTRKCLRCGKPVKEFAVRKSKNVKFVVAVHVPGEKKKIEQHYLGVVNDPEIEKLLGDRDPQMRLNDILRDVGLSVEGWLMILDELKRDLDYLIDSEQDKKKFLVKLNEIEHEIINR